MIDTRTGQVVGLADLLTTEANGIAFAVSGQVARPLLEAWRVAPQPVSAATCGGGSVTRQAAPPPQSSTPPGSGVATFTGRYFSVAYPSNWDVEAAEVQKGTYLDTTIADPAERSVYLRVDVTPNAPADLGANANPVLQALRRQPGYRELALVRTTFNGYDAIYWEFLVSQAGVLLHKVDIFFIDQYGEGLGVLTQAPAAAWSSWASTFAALRESLSIP